MAHDLLVCLGVGLVQYVCVRKKAFVYRTITTDEIYIHPGSAWFRNAPQYILAGEIVMTAKMYARTVSPLYPDWVSEISPSLSDKLRKMSKESPERERPIRESGRSSSRGAYRQSDGKVAKIYGFEFPVIKDVGKKNTRNVVVIPASDLSALAKSFRRASRHPKGITATVLYNGSYVCYGDRLYDIVSLDGRVDFGPEGYVEHVPETVYNVDNIRDLIPHLYKIIKLAPLKDRGKLGFIELLVSGKGSVFFHVNRNFSEAVNNTAYTLLGIMDEVKMSEFSKAYNRILRLLD